MIVSQPPYGGPGPSLDLQEQYRKEEEHIREFILWTAGKAGRPLQRNDFIDAYEEYVESLGANRTVRRQILWAMEMNFTRGVHQLTHYSLGLLEELNGDHFWYSFQLTGKGKEYVRGMSQPVIPDSVWKRVVR